ncbi:MAG: SAM-dependent methyltransferase [Alphaproteobacteria bacterium]
MTPDLPAEHDTPLGRLLATEIAAAGPMPCARFMALCLGHPQHGYYITRDPLGAAGDFTTAPEISQVFGELIGLWIADLWTRMGAPDRFTLVELGPGRGTLMGDACRAMRLLPACLKAAQIALVETSPTLRKAQAETLARHAPGKQPDWFDRVEELPEDAPLIVIANEFFDALPVAPHRWSGSDWHEWQIGLAPEQGFVIGQSPDPTPLPHAPTAKATGDVFELAETSAAVMSTLASKIARSTGAALIIDYGHPQTSIGETVQALHRHAQVPLLHRPGQSDLTAHVDFALLAAVATNHGLIAAPLLTQAHFLASLGLQQRAEQLIAGKPAEQAADIASRINRLVDPTQMGALFKALTVASDGLQSE